MLTNKDGYFLSGTNAAATIDQRELEALALRVMEMPAVRKARELSGFYWRRAMEPDWADETRVTFAEAMEEYAFNYVLKAVNSDANYPRVIQDFLPAHDWMGQRCPGARIGGDNPDNVYRLIPIAHGADYEILGQMPDPAPASLTFTLVANYGTTKTIQTLDAAELKLAADRSFTLTIGSERSAPGSNHMTTKPGTLFLFIRDSMSDWETQTCCALRVRRLTAPDAAPITLEKMAERAAENMFDAVPLYYWYQRTCQYPANVMSPASSSGGVGGLVTQGNSVGGFVLGDNDAMVVTVNRGGAAYSSIVAHDMWYRTIEYWKRTSSFNLTQSAPNEDGTYTYVFSRFDPGVHNWVDIGGLHRTIVLQRWQGLPSGEQRFTLSAKNVQRNDLAMALPKHIPTVTSAERKRQCEAREHAFYRRLVDS